MSNFGNYLSYLNILHKLGHNLVILEINLSLEYVRIGICYFAINCASLGIPHMNLSFKFFIAILTKEKFLLKARTIKYGNPNYGYNAKKFYPIKKSDNNIVNAVEGYDQSIQLTRY